MPLLLLLTHLPKEKGNIILPTYLRIVIMLPETQHLFFALWLFMFFNFFNFNFQRQKEPATIYSGALGRVSDKLSEASLFNHKSLEKLPRFLRHIFQLKTPKPLTYDRRRRGFARRAEPYPRRG